jgi:hypothetical protein
MNNNNNKKSNHRVWLSLSSGVYCCFFYVFSVKFLHLLVGSFKQVLVHNWVYMGSTLVGEFRWKECAYFGSIEIEKAKIKFLS